MTDRCVVVGCDWGGLGVLEDLRAVGIETLAVRNRSQEFANFSRFASQSVTIPLTNTPPKEFLEALDAGGKWHGSSLIATTDTAVEYISRHREAFREHFHFFTADWETTATLLDKERLYRHADKLGIPLPRTVDTPTHTDPSLELCPLEFPVIVKPRQSHEFFVRFRAKMFVARHKEELQSALKLAHDADLEVVISEIIPGDDSNLFQYRVYVDRDGLPLAEVCTQKLRQHPPGFGCGRICRTTPMIEEIRASSLRLLESCNYRGLAHIEFKWDPRDERYKLIEVNLRPPMTQRLYRAAGVNFSHLAHLECVEGVSKVVPGYETDVHWIDLFMDPLGWIRWRRVESRKRGAYFKPYLARRVFNVSPLSDPIPFLAKAWILAKQAPGFATARRDELAGPILSSRNGPAIAAHQSRLASPPIVDD